MGRISVINDEARYTESGVPLKDTTVFFESDQYEEATDHARRKRSYVGIAKDEKKEIIGYYVPS